MRHFVSTPIIDEGVVWTGGTPEEQGYKIIPIPSLKRPDAKNNEYYVYSNETEFKAVEADSAVGAVSVSEIANPHKIIHAHCRMEDVMDSKKLVYVEKDTGYMAKKGFPGNKAASEPTAKIESTGQPDIPADKPAADSTISAPDTAGNAS